MRSVLSQEIMSKYGSKKSYTGDVFLDVSGFNSGVKIYISVTTHDYCYNTYLEYKFYIKVSLIIQAIIVYLKFLIIVKLLQQQMVIAKKNIIIK